MYQCGNINPHKYPYVLRGLGHTCVESRMVSFESMLLCSTWPETPQTASEHLTAPWTQFYSRSHCLCENRRKRKTFHLPSRVALDCGNCYFKGFFMFDYKFGNLPEISLVLWAGQKRFDHKKNVGWQTTDWPPPTSHRAGSVFPRSSDNGIR